MDAFQSAVPLFTCKEGKHVTVMIIQTDKLVALYKHKNNKIF